MSKITTAIVLCCWWLTMIGPALVAQPSPAQTETAQQQTTNDEPNGASSSAAAAADETGSRTASADDSAASDDTASDESKPETKAAANTEEAETEKSWLSVAWQLNGMDLKRASLIAIAFLAAFLTVVGIWRIPARSSIFMRDKDTPDDGKDDDDNDRSPFDTNFGRTVVSGLTGMVAVTFLDSYWNQDTLNSKAYYLFWFVLFFVSLLFMAALIKGINEAQRSRLANQSWRATWVIFIDTFLNYLQGRNQSQTAPLTGEIKRLHDSSVDVAELLCRQLETTLCNFLSDSTSDDSGAVGKPLDGDLRVAVSVLADDASYATYIARPSGNLARRFPKKSLAWLSLYSGRALWWKDGNPVYRNAVVPFEADDEKPLLPEKADLSDYFQSRGRDYNGFVVLPVPWLNRGIDSGMTRAGIHISFREAAWMDRLWKRLEIDAAADAPAKDDVEDGNGDPKPMPPAGEPGAQKAPTEEPGTQKGTAQTPVQEAPAQNADHQVPNYQGWESMLRVKVAQPDDVSMTNEEISLALQHATAVLATLLRDFNLPLFEHFVPQPPARIS